MGPKELLAAVWRHITDERENNYENLTPEQLAFKVKMLDWFVMLTDILWYEKKLYRRTEIHSAVPPIGHSTIRLITVDNLDTIEIEAAINDRQSEKPDQRTIRFNTRGHLSVSQDNNPFQRLPYEKAHEHEEYFETAIVLAFHDLLKERELKKLTQSK